MKNYEFEIVVTKLLAEEFFVTQTRILLAAEADAVEAKIA